MAFSRTTSWVLVAFLVLLGVWKALLWLYTPLPTTDAVQMLSHTFSVLRGDFLLSTYWHNWMTLYQLPYGYGLFTAPLMGLLPFGMLNNYFAIALIFATLSAGLAYRLISLSSGTKRVYAALAAVAVFTHPQLWIMRPESIIVPLLLAALILVRTPPRKRTLGIVALLVALAGLTQPLGGLIGVMLILMTEFEQRWAFRQVVLFAGMVAAWLALLYGPIILIDVPLWIENFIGFFTQEEPRGLATLTGALRALVRVGGWTVPLFALYGFGLFASRRQAGFSLLREALWLLILFLPMLMGGTGNYFSYLIVFAVWRLSRLPWLAAPSRALSVALALIAPFFAVYVPTFQNLENPRYGETIRAVLQAADRYSDRTEPGLVWVSTQAGYPLEDEPYARVLANYFELGRYDAPILLGVHDVVLYQWASERDVLLRNYAVTAEQLNEEVIIEPVPGLLTVESGFRARLPDIGLWRITLR